MDKELRLKIYEILGLEVGSLASESGNDWERAKKEALEDRKQREYEILKNNKSINYISIGKDSNEYKIALYSPMLLTYTLKALIAQRNDLQDNEIDTLIASMDKDILINLSKYQKLTTEQIDQIIPISVYLVKKNLLENQILTEEQKRNLKTLMKDNIQLYSDLIAKIS